MKVILFVLDNPKNIYEWFVKDIELKDLRDIEKIMGYCAMRIYAELYQIDKDDDPVVIKKVRECLSNWYPETAKNTIMLLFRYTQKIVELKETGETLK